MLEHEQKIGAGEFISLYFNLILVHIRLIFSIIFMLSLDEIGSNLPHSVRILLIKWFFLFSGALTKNIRKSIVLIERKAVGTSFEEQKRFNEVLSARKARVKGQGECTIGRAPWHNCAAILQSRSNFPKLRTGSARPCTC